MTLDSAEPRDEVSYSDYLKACGRLEVAARMLKSGADPDSAAQHWLPQVTAQIALIFSFVGSNMAARHVPQFVRTVAAYEFAKDVTQVPPSGRVPDTNPQQEEHDGGITGEPGPGPAGGPDQPGEPSDG